MCGVPASHCWITRCADGALPPAATGTVSKTGNLQPVSRSCVSSPSPKTGCPPLPISRGLSPGEDVDFSLLKASRCSQLQPPDPSVPLPKARLTRSRARRVGSRWHSRQLAARGHRVPSVTFCLDDNVQRSITDVPSTS